MCSTEKNTWEWFAEIDTYPELLHVFGDEVLLSSWDDLPHLSSPRIFALPSEWQHIITETPINSVGLDTEAEIFAISLHQDYFKLTMKDMLILSVGTALSSLSTNSPTVPSSMLTSHPTYPGLCDCVEHS